MIFQEGPVPNPSSSNRNNRKQFPLCLVMAPTRELASQIYDEARKVREAGEMIGMTLLSLSLILVLVSIHGSFVRRLRWS